MREKVTYAVDTARPYVERIAQDEELHDHVKNAYASARSIYDQLLGGRGATGAAMRSRATRTSRTSSGTPWRSCARPAGASRERRPTRSGTCLLLLTGITLGVLFNPKTGPDTRKWLKDKVLGPEQPFEYQSNEN